MDTNTLFFGMLFSIIGMSYFAYGRKNNYYFMLSGIVLMVYPYFVNSVGWLIGIGVALSAIPFVLPNPN